VRCAHAQSPAALAEESQINTSRAAVLADAEALLTCYGAGEESGAELVHSVVELSFTSSVRFLQPGLLLKVLFRHAWPSLKPIGYPWSYLAARIGHCVPIWQPFIGTLRP
jgi:hypothetical protein